MSAQDNAALARKMYELWSNNQLNEILALATEDIEVVLTPFGQTFHGHAGFADFNQGFKGAFPDIKITEITHQIATENEVVSEFKARGTHTGPLMTPAGEVSATGRTVAFSVCEVCSVRDGKVASIRNYQDAASIMRQLGLA